eukprot:8960768-Pyramimonas_sp.AAC.1
MYRYICVYTRTHALAWANASEVYACRCAGNYCRRVSSSRLTGTLYARAHAPDCARVRAVASSSRVR